MPSDLPDLQHSEPDAARTRIGIGVVALVGLLAQFLLTMRGANALAGDTDGETRPVFGAILLGVATAPFLVPAVASAAIAALGRGRKAALSTALTTFLGTELIVIAIAVITAF